MKAVSAFIDFVLWQDAEKQNRFSVESCRRIKKLELVLP
jgi:hypothetical protein